MKLALPLAMAAILAPCAMVAVMYAQTPNDSCLTAIEITSLPFEDEQDTRQATADPNDPVLSCALGGGGKTVWYKFTPEETVFLRASTESSFFEFYNTALAVFTGSCDSLVEIACNDDIIAGVLVLSTLQFKAEAGVTYYLHVAEWNGGGPDGGDPTGGDLKFVLREIPLFQGPVMGSSSGGDSLSTDELDDDGATADIHNQIFRSQAAKSGTTTHRAGGVAEHVTPSQHTEPSDVADRTVVRDGSGSSAAGAGAVLEHSFAGIPDDGSSIPPDPAIAAGPDHLMALVNSRIAIFDKTTGEMLQLFDAGDWFTNVFRRPVPCNSQIIYDHFARRWLMVWIECSQAPEALFLAISDDADPTGKWCNWNMRPTPTDEAIGLNALPRLGVDADAYYISTDIFARNQYVSVRVIPKAQLLDGSCGPISWWDFWDLRIPGDLTRRVKGVAPAVAFGAPGKAYLMDVDMVNETGSFVNLWTIDDPVGAPTLAGQTIPVAPFAAAADAQQLGGGDLPLEITDRRNHNVVFRNGSLWTAHTISDSSGLYAQARYLRIDAASGTVLEDVAFGRDHFWYMYPVVMPDSSNNLFMVFSRSGQTEYANARYTGRLASQPANILSSILMKAGEANYVKTFGSNRNRWGSYSGIALDPVDASSVWMISEYAAEPVGSGANSDRWGTWIAKASFVPKSGPRILVDPKDGYDFNLDFFRSANSVPVPITISNQGDEVLMVDSIHLSQSDTPFELRDLPDLPLALESFQHTTFRVLYAPETGVMFEDSLVIVHNDPGKSDVVLKLTGVVPAILNIMPDQITTTLAADDSTELQLEVRNPGGLSLNMRAGFTGIMNFVAQQDVDGSPQSRTDAGQLESDGAALRQAPVSALSSNRADTEVLTETHAPALQTSESSKQAMETEVANVPLVLFDIDAASQAQESAALGVAFDGEHFWVTGGGALLDTDPNRLFRYDVHGNLEVAFFQGTSSVFGWRDLAYDGAFLYTSDSDTIVQIDPRPELPRLASRAIKGPLELNRALAYDPATDHFWTANFATDIFEFDRDGAIVNSYANELQIYGMAWDDSNPARPFLWVWAQFLDGTGSLAAQFDPHAGVYTGLTFDGVILTGRNNFAGGATITRALPTEPPNQPVFVGLQQDDPDRFFGYALPPAWMTGITPRADTLARTDSLEIVATLNTTGLDAGGQTGGIIINSNDFDFPQKVIEVRLDVVTTVSESPADPIPSDFVMHQNYPNPFNPETSLRFELPEAAPVSLAIYDVLGRKVRSLLSESMQAGSYEVVWRGRDEAGVAVASGVYFVRIQAGEVTRVGKMLLLR